ncbi:unnamed protein product [Lepeophtheirus salmonis]|uniref:(salmon louse) hypothetical protein n=1 Tax=Lepeophtheirus salmonis TaxID=72036 RepID=A0A7R8HAI4_LEPSM|nr:unnamed protein product [Lepeophtheirus salmonis]CAF2967394.1 unnamed protein product [Lepeophtheirus salmonis]
MTIVIQLVQRHHGEEEKDKKWFHILIIQVFSRSMAKKRKYFEGILANAKSLHIYYPGWIMRVYYDLHDFHPQLKELCRIVCIYDHVDLCNIRHLPGKLADESLRMFGMLWRFLPVIDPHVDLLLSRDLDSRFSNRELTAVQEWMNSDKILHIMRDHPFHNVPILGGLWGANLTNKESRILWEISWKNILLDSGAWASRFSRGSDQVLLKKYVWDTWGWNYALQHDSYKCKRFANSKPWPVERLKGVNNFVGAISNLNKTLVRECPKECRKYIEWKYC